MHVLECPDTFRQERQYVADVVLGDFLGLSFDIRFVNRKGVALRLNEKSVELSDAFFEQFADLALLKSEISRTSKLHWFDTSPLAMRSNLIFPQVPVLYGEGILREKGDSLHLGIDILGSIFFMLARCEEQATTQRDSHGRFPAVASLAYRNDFVERPIVDEYTEILWYCIKRVWTGIRRKASPNGVFVTCDVDEPYEYSLNDPIRTLRRVSGDLVKRHSIREAVTSARNAFARCRGDLSRDRYNTFDWIMDVCEQHGKKAAFYFLAGRSSAQDGEYGLDEPNILSLLKSIDERGHEIGLHGSYNSFDDSAMLGNEKRSLENACKSAGVGRPIRGARQHYLRWDSARSPAAVENVGLEYDSTGAYADMAGFRYGTSRSFKMWDWQARRKTQLVQRPLIVMETTVMSCEYQNLGSTRAALEKMLELKERSMRLGGNFVLLWHNSTLVLETHRNLFRTVLEQ